MADSAAENAAENAAESAPESAPQSAPQSLQALQAQVHDQEQVINALREELAGGQAWQRRVPNLVRFGQTLAKLPSFKAAAADAAIAATRVPVVTTECDDLADVHGIGAAYEQRLYAVGVGTFWELAHVTDEDFGRILRPTPLQRSTLNCEAIRADALRLATEANKIGLLWKGETPDDFEPIKGIGSTFEQRLYEAGIRTYRALAAATAEELAVICHTGTMPVQPDYSDWIAQARALAQQQA
jgi:predicted flap endonuclease-1-like 5' DNA nuclease